PLWPSHLRAQAKNRKRRPRKAPRDHYSSASYRRSIAYAVVRANRDRAERNEPPIPDWHPHQLRHAVGTLVRREFDLDTSKAVLGHSSPVVTEVYAELDQAKARAVMETIG